MLDCLLQNFVDAIAVKGLLFYWLALRRVSGVPATGTPDGTRNADLQRGLKMEKIK
jgi:hypothetical protein